ncbi:MAG: heat-inducible transcriptional repressor HrcA [Propionibacteriaceae bacterium]|nr:heat-inducible transcriptional repressor HrcA [Propionibacteriaceae bacterium]
MLDDRKLDVLRAVVVDYVQSHEPVGSRALVERHRLDVSPATIRNDMAALEEEGYLAQPHTSAGRVPTDKGYRLFVDKLATVKPLSTAERRAIGTFMQGAIDVDDVVARTARLLAQLTHQVAIVQYPFPAPVAIRHIEVVQLSPGRLLVIIIRSNGSVDQRALECQSSTEDDITQLRSWVNQVAAGLTPQLAISQLRQAVDDLPPPDQQRTSALVAALTQMLGASPSARVAVGGVPNLARFGAEYEAMIEPLLEAIEEQVVLLRLLGEAARDLGDVTVRIGAENTYGPLRETSVVTSTYAPRSRGVAALGVVGPTRMDYPSTMAAVRSVARYVSRFLGGDVDVY